MHTEGEVRRFLAAQLGLITLDQVLDVGGTRSLAAYRVKTGTWATVLPGVFRDTVVMPSLEQLGSTSSSASPTCKLDTRVLPVTWDDITDTR